jgi:hypothetical protein
VSFAAQAWLLAGLAVGGVVFGFALGALSMWARVRGRPPTHEHDWSKWQTVEAKYSRFPIFGTGPPTVMDCTVQMRTCTDCGFKQTVSD